MNRYLLIDGENFVHKLCLSLKKQKIIRSRTNLKKINLGILFKNIKNSQKLYYSTNIIMPKKTSRQFENVEKMRLWNKKWVPYIANQGVSFVKAGFLRVRPGKRCLDCGRNDEIMVEKGVDVRIAVDIVSYAAKWVEIFLLSSDTDLLPAVKKAKQLGAKIVYVAFEGEIVRAISLAANETLVLKDRDIVSAYKDVN
ncbi:hypothetical protein FACS189431_3140 [Alphaproteobacteria bacterium]|nr:hypothetical protein FACS189431_3140 [Alphaproteobacteria bacterium]